MTHPEQHAIELTQRLVRLNTVNPPGNEHAAALLLGEMLREAGFTVAYHAFATGRTSVVARYASHAAAESLCFTGHLDTVPLGAAAWAQDAHGGEIVDDRLYGRGSSDMKAGIAAFVAAALAHVRRTPRAANLTLVLTAGEETGCEGAHHMASTGALDRVGALIVAEPTANYPMIGHKGVLWLTARTRGVAAHGSTPDAGINAIYRARRILEKLERYRFAMPAHAQLGTPTLNVGTLVGGSNINTVPDRAELGIDIRTIPGMRSDALRERLREELAPDLSELEDLTDLDPVWTDPEVPWIQRVYDLLTPLLGSRPQPRGASYFTDACALKRAYADAPTLILGPGEPKQAHQTDEYCHVSRIAQAVDIYACLLRDWNQGVSVMTADEKPRLVGPVVTCGEFADAVLESMEEDNPDKTFVVVQNAAYMRIQVEGECILRMATLERALGRPVRRGDLEMNMPSFAGFIQTLPDHVRFFSKQ